MHMCLAAMMSQRKRTSEAGVVIAGRRCIDARVTPVSRVARSCVVIITGDATVEATIALSALIHRL